MRSIRTTLSVAAAFAALTTATLTTVTTTTAAADAGTTTPASGRPAVGSPAYVLRDAQNILDSFGRITGPGGQLLNPAYLPALIKQIGVVAVLQLTTQLANPTRLALTLGNLVPGWNVGNPLRASWDGTRGQMTDVAFTNRYGALLRGTVYRPLPGAKDPYTGQVLSGPFPGVVITEGSIQGSAGMYRWLAQDLAERGYVVLTYDVQGQGTSETLPHTTGTELPFCNPLSAALPGETTGCPGVPSQQLSNFVVGTEDALSFFTSTPSAPYANPLKADAKVSSYNPYWETFDHSPDPNPATPGRTSRIAIIGHSMGATAVSQVQGYDTRVATVVALDKLVDSDPSVPALALQSEYGFVPTTWNGAGTSSFSPGATPNGPDPERERATGYDAWRAHDLDSMVIVPRASTHMEYTDIPLVMPASRYGQDVSSHYVQAWLDHYLKHRDNLAELTGSSFTYLEPRGGTTWAPVTLQRDQQLSFYYCSAWHLHDGSTTIDDPDVNHVGGCAS